MEPPQLRCAEAPMRTSLGAPVPMFVDESVGNIWVQECQELGGASRRKRRVHGPANYSLKLYLSAKSGEQHISRTTCLLHITYTEIRNTLSNGMIIGVSCEGSGARRCPGAGPWPICRVSATRPNPALALQTADRLALYSSNPAPGRPESPTGACSATIRNG